MTFEARCAHCNRKLFTTNREDTERIYEKNVTRGMIIERPPATAGEAAIFFCSMPCCELYGTGVKH